MLLGVGFLLTAQVDVPVELLGVLAMEQGRRTTTVNWVGPEWRTGRIREEGASAGAVIAVCGTPSPSSANGGGRSRPALGPVVKQ